MTMQVSQEKKEKFYSLVSDTTFKYLYKNEETRKWLEEIILEKFNIDLSEYVLVNNEDNTGNSRKDYLMDLVLYNETDEIKDYVVIEMNSEYSSESEIKAKLYVFRKLGKSFDKGEEYNKKPRAKLIIFNNYLNQKDSSIKDIKYSLYNKEHDIELDDIEICEIYLKLLHQMCYDKCNKIDKRLWLFGCESYEELIAHKDKDNKVIIEEMERLKMDEEFRDEYDYENVQRKLRNSARDNGYKEGKMDGILEGISQGVKQGVEQGISQSKNEIAKNMLKDGMKLSSVSKFTGLSKEELEKLS